MSLPIIENIANKAAEAVKAMILEKGDQIRKDFHYIIANTPDKKKATLRLTHAIVLDLDASTQKDTLRWSTPRCAEATVELTGEKKPSDPPLGE